MRSYVIIFIFIQCLAWSFFFEDLSKSYIRKVINVLNIIQWKPSGDKKLKEFVKVPASDVVILRDDKTFTLFYANGNTLEGTWIYDGHSSLVQLQHPEFEQTYSVESMIDDNLLVLKASGKQEYDILAENSPLSFIIEH